MGRRPSLRDFRNISVKMGANSRLHSLSTVFGIRSGPLALFILTSVNNFWTPLASIVTWGILGRLYGTVGTGARPSSFVNTDVYCSHSISALSWASSQSLPLLSISGGIPIFSFLRLFMYAQAFLLSLSSSSAKMFVKYSVCASLSCFFKSLSIPLYRFQSATFPVFLDFALASIVELCLIVELYNRLLQLCLTIKQSSTIDCYSSVWIKPSSTISVTAVIKQSSTIDCYSNNQTELYNWRLTVNQTELYNDCYSVNQTEIYNWRLQL